MVILLTLVLKKTDSPLWRSRLKVCPHLPMPPSSICTGAQRPGGYNKAHLQVFSQVSQAWMISRIPGGAESLDQLVCDGKTLRCSAVEIEDGSHRYGLRPTTSMVPRTRFTPALLASPLLKGPRIFSRTI